MVDKIVIPYEVQSRNKIDKMHWSEKSRLRQVYQLLVRQQMSKYRIKKADVGECHDIVITTYRKHPAN